MIVKIYPDKFIRINDKGGGIFFWVNFFKVYINLTIAVNKK